MAFPRNGVAVTRVNPDGATEKLCTGCDTFKPATVDHFHRHRAKPDGLQSRCKECQRIACRPRSAEQWRRIVEKAAERIAPAPEVFPRNRNRRAWVRRRRAGGSEA